MAYKWIRKAQENGAKIIHVDPRYTRTSASADVYARIRPGTDAAFQNTMINHILVNKLYDEDYVVTHTNALYLSDEAFDFKDGVFSGYDEEHHKYDTKTWGYQLDAKGKPRVARSLDDPHCVFSRLKTHVSRYTLEIGRADHRHPGRADPADRGNDGEEPARRHPVRPRDDAAHDGRAGDPVVHDPAAPARQHRQARRRRQRAARRAERAGRVRHGGALQLLPGLPQFSVQRRADHLRLRAQERDRRQPVPRQHAQGVLRRRGDRRERLRLWLAPQAERRQGLRNPADVRGCARREAEAPLDRRPESRGHGAQPQADVRRDGEARDARGPGDLGDRDRDVLEAARASIRRPSPPRSSSCRPRSSWKRTEPSRTRAAWCSGGTPR